MVGAIPAWAGEPKIGGIANDLAGGHPRVGGGTDCAAAPNGPVEGPSPRGRGNLLRGLDHLLGRGAIPAWAGEPQ